jgi:DNA-binding beta-propeller fold protein YncE
MVVALAAVAASLDAQTPAPASRQPSSSTPYTLYVTSESGDIVTRIEVGPAGWRRVREVGVGIIPTDPDGPHHVAVSPDGRYWYVSIAHGTPFGSIWKYATGSDTLLGRVRVGMFPTTIGLSPDGDWAFVPNSDFHGDRGHQNTVSVIHTPDMTELVAIPTCDMPHGSRFNRAGTRVYIACMMSDELVEMDPATFAITRRVVLGSGNPMSMAEHQRMEARQDSLEAARARGAVAAAGAGHDAHAAHQPAPAQRPALGAASSTMPGQNPDCLTTYVSVSPDDQLLYLACSHSNEVQVRDARTLELVRRLPTGNGAYNVEPSPDGRWLLVTNKKAQSVSVFDTRDWSERARITTTKRIPHGIAFSPDGRWAFVTQESIGSDPGALDAIDLATMQRVATMEIPLQPTGIAVVPARD